MSEPKIEIVDIPYVGIRGFLKYKELFKALEELPEGKALYIRIEDYPQSDKPGFASSVFRNLSGKYVIHCIKDGNGGRYIWKEKRA